MQLYLAFYQQMSLPMFCCILQESGIAQGSSVICQNFWSNLVKEIVIEVAQALIQCIFPYGVWTLAGCVQVHSPWLTICKHMQCYWHSSANKPVLQEVRIFWIYEYFSVSNLFFVCFCFFKSLPPILDFFFFLAISYFEVMLLDVALSFHPVPDFLFFFSDSKNSGRLLHWYFY